MKRKKILYFVSVSTLPQPYYLKNTMYRKPKLLYIPGTENCTRAADLQTIQPHPPSLQISMLRLTITTASLKFALSLFVRIPTFDILNILLVSREANSC